MERHAGNQTPFLKLDGAFARLVALAASPRAPV